MYIWIFSCLLYGKCTLEFLLFTEWKIYVGISPFYGMEKVHQNFSFIKMYAGIFSFLLYGKKYIRFFSFLLDRKCTLEFFPFYYYMGKVHWNFSFSLYGKCTEKKYGIYSFLLYGKCTLEYHLFTVWKYTLEFFLWTQWKMCMK